MSVNRTPAQKGLKVVSILVLIGAICSIIIGIMGLAGGGFVLWAGDQAAGTDTAAVEGAALLSTVLIALSAAVLISGIFSIIEAVFGFGASKDASKASYAFVMGVIVVVLTVISSVLSIVALCAGSEQNVFGTIVNIIVSLIIPVLYLNFAAKIKQGK